MESANERSSILSQKKKQFKKLFPTKTTFLRSSAAIRNRMTANRTYGFMRTTNTGTPYPRKADPLDSGTLSARLAAASKFRIAKIKDSDEAEDIESTSDKCSATDSHGDGDEDGEHKVATGRPSSFKERRKLFDLAEFTICKGRKLSDAFHHSEFDIDDYDMPTNHIRLGGSVGNYSSFTITSYKAQSLRNFKEMEAFCLARNIRLNQGIEFGIAKKL